MDIQKIKAEIILNLGDDLEKVSEATKERLFSLVEARIKDTQKELLDELKREIFQGKYDLKDLLFWINCKKNFKEVSK